ncbi:hypothetical protein [Spiroplasma endosymbiont of Notiophilus biguttatus]|uniref:hypothetical protein n=1 Tax=Spiroplasma endosymbiont of Notiophilus biguttatus TaxID=3066285 RepID=UPI00313D247E
MAKKKDNDDWRKLNNITKYVTGKVEPVKVKKSFLTITISLIMIIGLAISTFFIALAMQSAFNIGDFKQNISEESIIVDMNDVPIDSSNKNLRLPFFEEESKKQVFDLLIKESWWDSFFPTNITNYDFTFYKPNSNDELDKSLIQTDGVTKFDLKLKLQSSFIEFKIPVIALIKNTAKFYEKFMMFNQFEGKFSKHISGKFPNGNDYLQEQWTHGYLPNNFYYADKIDNTVVYKTIEDEINRFINDYEEEFTSATHLYPIISTIPLANIDFNDATTIKPYFELVHHPELNYVGNAVTSSKEYVNLYSYSSNFPLKPFYITYVSNPNVVYDFIELKPTNIEEIIDYLKVNSIDFVPFSMIQEAADSDEALIKYSPPYVLLTSDNSGNHFKYKELSHYFGFSNSINNSIENMNVNDYVNIGDLETFLENKYWQEMYQFAKNNSTFFLLDYPDSMVDPTTNWNLVIKSLDTFKGYFVKALKVQINELTTFTFLDIDGNNLSLKATDIINTDDIKKIRFHIGKDLTSSDYVPKPHSFNFTFKVKWF